MNVDSTWDWEVKNGAVHVYIKDKEYKYTFASFGRKWQVKFRLTVNLSHEPWYLLGETRTSRCSFSGLKEDGANLAWVVGNFASARAPV